MVKKIMMEIITGGWNTKLKQAETGTWRSFKPVIDDTCKNCGICLQFCPEATIKLDNKKPKIDYRYCKGCGICSNECPIKAIKIISEK